MRAPFRREDGHTHRVLVCPHCTFVIDEIDVMGREAGKITSLTKKSGGEMNDKQLRNQLIRLAHTHPSLRGDLLPLIKVAEAEAGEALTEASLLKYLDETDDEVTVHSLSYAFDMPHQKVKGLLQKMVKGGDLVYKGGKYSKKAGCEKLPEGGMRENCEKKVEEGKEGKEAALRAGLIRLAYTNPEIRANILPLVAKTAPR